MTALWFPASIPSLGWRLVCPLLPPVRGVASLLLSFGVVILSAASLFAVYAVARAGWGYASRAVCKQIPGYPETDRGSGGDPQRAPVTDDVTAGDDESFAFLRDNWRVQLARTTIIVGGAIGLDVLLQTLCQPAAVVGPFHSVLTSGRYRLSLVTIYVTLLYFGGIEELAVRFAPVDRYEDWLKPAVLVGVPALALSEQSFGLFAAVTAFGAMVVGAYTADSLFMRLYFVFFALLFASISVLGVAAAFL